MEKVLSEIAAVVLGVSSVMAESAADARADHCHFHESLKQKVFKSGGMGFGFVTGERPVEVVKKG